ncbi:flagellar export chaperone FliS [Alkalihalophilus pseudofirmus]|uniref:flagellar export chaperone FliS n=1 Tax=Alkalihalobacterium alkalinitrilicum TaxID=427920 RepID=UPI00094C9B07|nr:flagellar export chaperone FliS [Alkalihalobacterium alkalinitrilicum]OLO42799.1 flagellar export chaperone FliS [Alkalihalophilus pseudofirmus]
MSLITKEALHKKSPQEITALLYEACIVNLEESKEAIIEKNYSLANSKLQKANDILHRLGSGLNYEAGIIADQLEAVYNYMAECLIKANIYKDVAIIDEVIILLTNISSAWSKALVDNRDIQSKTIKQKANAYEQNSIYDN